MAQYTITYKCGHEAIEQLYGKETEREHYLDYAGRSKLCPACYAEAQARLRAEERAAYAATNAAYGALSGSDKQQSWAQTIRGTFLADLARMPIKDATGVNLIHEAVKRQGTARWWIDHRHDLDNAITGVKLLVKEDAVLAASFAAQRAQPRADAPPDR